MVNCDQDEQAYGIVIGFSMYGGIVSKVVHMLVYGGRMVIERPVMAFCLAHQKIPMNENNNNEKLANT